MGNNNGTKSESSNGHNKIAGLIAISSQEQARHSLFWASLLKIECPTGTVVEIGRGANVVDNRNRLSQLALEIGANWILYLDDDQVLPPDTLNRLLAHDVDIVSALYLYREPPFAPIMFDREDERGRCFPSFLSPLDGGLVRRKAAGGGCLLIKRKVLEAVEKPWWRLGQIESDKWGDDLDFCRRARSAGFDIHVDLDTRIGHIPGGMALWPNRDEAGNWMTTLVQHEPLASWPAAFNALDPRRAGPTGAMPSSLGSLKLAER